MCKNKILFGYRLGNAGCCEDEVDNDGFSLVIYENGIAEYKTYVFNNIQIEYEKFYINLKIVEEIKSIIYKNRRKIKSLDDYIYNESCDGSMNKFIFGKK
ncbi:MAG: hypothetical protein IJZ64_04240 [Ruminococcus sp.]|nr:hypothetical protein [Ruminococcus sp.]